MKLSLEGVWEQIFRNFLAQEKMRRTAQGFTTLRKASRFVLRWMQSENLRPAVVTRADVLRFREIAGGNRLKAPTVIVRLRAGRSLFRYLVENNAAAFNPFLEVEYPKEPERVCHNLLSVEDMRRLLKSLERYSEVTQVNAQKFRYRLHVLAELLYATGMRISEAAALVPADIQLPDRLIYVRHGKGSKPRITYLTDYATAVLRNYITKGRPLFTQSNTATTPRNAKLFCLGRQRLMVLANQGFREICEQQNLPVITSHGFRHSLGTHLLQAGCDIRCIQVILGHQRLSTTQIYTTLDKEALRDCLDRFHPRK
jgi:integrase/recombinase XerC